VLSYIFNVEKWTYNTRDIYGSTTDSVTITQDFLHINSDTEISYLANVSVANI